MIFIILGSSGGLGSYIINTLRAEGKCIYGLDLMPSQTTTDVVDFANIENLKSCINSIVSSNVGPFCCVYAAIPSNRTRGQAKLLEYLQESNSMISLQFNTLLVLADALVSYSNSQADSNSNNCKSHLINIGSVLSTRVSFAESPVYGSAKAAAHELIRYLSVSLASYNINCNSISPALMARNETSRNYLVNKLAAAGKSACITSYKEVLSVIKAIANNDLSSMRGHNIILDHGLEHFEAFHMID
mgnify:CR=1 FL=1